VFPLANRLRFLFSLLAAALLAAGAPRVDCVLIHKARHEMLLLSGSQVVKRYRVALGPRSLGPKRRRGDGRTPEGEYFIRGRNARSAFHKSLRISYPGPDDVARARKAGVDPGGDIMIHGLPNGQGWIGAAHRVSDWTQGCIAVTDQEIEEIWILVADRTRVRIEP
jgi:murein L,D-transpeptidase YafK